MLNKAVKSSLIPGGWFHLSVFSLITRRSPDWEPGCVSPVLWMTAGSTASAGGGRTPAGIKPAVCDTQLYQEPADAGGFLPHHTVLTLPVSRYLSGSRGRDTSGARASHFQRGSDLVVAELNVRPHLFLFFLQAKHLPGWDLRLDRTREMNCLPMSLCLVNSASSIFHADDAPDDVHRHQSAMELQRSNYAAGNKVWERHNPVSVRAANSHQRAELHTESYLSSCCWKPQVWLINCETNFKQKVNK